MPRIGKRQREAVKRLRAGVIRLRLGVVDELRAGRHQFARRAGRHQFTRREKPVGASTGLLSWRARSSSSTVKSRLSCVCISTIR